MSSTPQDGTVPPQPPPSGTAAPVDPLAVTLRPSRVAAGAWTIAGALAIALASYTLRQTSSPYLPSALLLLTIAVTSVHALQVFLPGAWTVHVDRDVVTGHVAGGEVHHELADVRAMTVERFLGDPVLLLHSGASRQRVLLPVGCDLAGLRRLAAAFDQDAAAGRRPPASVNQPPAGT